MEVRFVHFSRYRKGFYEKQKTKHSCFIGLCVKIFWHTLYWSWQTSTGGASGVGEGRGVGGDGEAGLERLRQHCQQGDHTAKNRYRKFETNIPRKVIARPQSQFPRSCVCGRFIYIPTIDLPILLQEICGLWTDPGNICILYKSLTDTCIWKLGRAFPRKGIHK